MQTNVESNKQPCPTCKGKGTQTCEFFEMADIPAFNKKGTFEMKCIMCDGRAFLGPAEYEQVLAIIKHNDEMWCKCKPRIYDQIFKDDGQCRMKSCGMRKHHYHCAGCKGVTQIG